MAKKGFVLAAAVLVTLGFGCASDGANGDHEERYDAFAKPPVGSWVIVDPQDLRANHAWLQLPRAGPNGYRMMTSDEFARALEDDRQAAWEECRRFASRFGTADGEPDDAIKYYRALIACARDKGLIPELGR